MDVWTLGMILLQCLSLEFRNEGLSKRSIEELMKFYKGHSYPSLIKNELEEQQAQMVINRN